MKVLNFSIGHHNKTGDEQWEDRLEEGGVTTLALVDRKSQLQPAEGQTRFMARESDPVFVSPDGKFRIVPFVLISALSQQEKEEPKAVVKDTSHLDHQIKQALAPKPTKRRSRRARKYVPLPENGERPPRRRGKDKKKKSGK